MINRSEAATLLLTAIAAASCPAQRAPIRGTVELEDGSPWVGATVTVLHRPVPADERFGTEDRDGAPAGGARVAIGLAAPGSEFDGALRDIGCNHAGRVRLLLPRSKHLAIATWTPSGSAVRALDTSLGGTGAGRLEMALQPVDQLPCRLVENGETVRADDVRVRYFPRLPPTGSLPETSDTLAWGISLAILLPRPDGSFSIPLHPGTVPYIQTANIGGRTHVIGRRLSLEGTPDLLDVPLRRR